MAGGIALGHLAPTTFAHLSQMEVAQVNLPMAALIWAMILPMLLRVDFGAMRDVGRHWRGIGVTLFVNWAIKPFSMALLA
ncbi:MAG TPA: arsenical-resistance protein, partial [Pseudoxanthomonas sp.]|nr:arsenical-resistance protein [Pseudoxanthomonas sp.]